jgi:hypothetical protein
VWRGVLRAWPLYGGRLERDARQPALEHARQLPRPGTRERQEGGQQQAADDERVEEYGAGRTRLGRNSRRSRSLALWESVPDSDTLLTKWFLAAWAAAIEAISIATHPIRTVLRCAARPSQLTAERENTRIEIAASATAHSATTARLSHASAVTLCIPQMSCRPLPVGSMSP